MRSAAPASSTSTTARSHASGSRPTTPPASPTTAPSLERNTRSRAARNTRLATDRPHGHHRHGRRGAAPQIAQRDVPGHQQDGLPRRRLREPREGEERRGADPARDADMVNLPTPHALNPLHPPARQPFSPP